MKPWKFVKSEDCWWLEISTIEQLLEYENKTNGKYGRALISDALQDEDSKKYEKLILMAKLYAQKDEDSMMNGMAKVSNGILSAKINAIQTNGKILINECGGFNYGLGIVKTTFRDKPVFPDF